MFLQSGLKSSLGVTNVGFAEVHGFLVLLSPHVNYVWSHDSLYDMTRDVTSTKNNLQKEEQHLSDVLRQNGYPVALIRSSSQPPRQRPPWVTTSGG